MQQFQPTDEYVNRLATEDALVKRYAPNFKLRRDEEGRYHYDGWQYACSGDRYRLRLSLGDGYPFIKPRLLLIDPAVVHVHGGEGILNAVVPSHRHHLDGPSSTEFLAVCFAGHWHANKTCIGVLICGVIWVECLDRYRRTGVTIASQIDEVKAQLFGDSVLPDIPDLPDLPDLSDLPRPNPQPPSPIS